jgi:hypothetical protein
MELLCYLKKYPYIYPSRMSVGENRKRKEKKRENVKEKERKRKA